MKKCLISFMTGCAVGMVLAYNFEDELDDTVHQACRYKKKMMRKMHQMSK